jgi:NAD(P)-dependent dehydrogenase (short-subunit alcohol dehydrogenase family)
MGSVTYDNSGRVVVVTGGCGGIGRAICEAFLRSSAHGIVCIDLSADLATDLPPGIEFRQADVSKEQDCRAAVDWTIQRFGAVDVLVNNAAIQPPDSYAPLDQFSSPLWDKMVGVNFSGYTFMAKYALRQMRGQQSGVVINIASAHGHRTSRGAAAYGPIKAANIMQAMQWGIEYARHGIRVVSVSPGAIDTPMVRATLEQQGGEAELANRHPLGRLGKPEEIAHAVLWLASSDASFITATDIDADGGLRAFGAFAEPYPMK